MFDSQRIPALTVADSPTKSNYDESSSSGGGIFPLNFPLHMHSMNGSAGGITANESKSDYSRQTMNILQQYQQQQQQQPQGLAELPGRRPGTSSRRAAPAVPAVPATSTASAGSGGGGLGGKPRPAYLAECSSSSDEDD
jgi:hypothetical protein